MTLSSEVSLLLCGSTRGFVEEAKMGVFPVFSAVILLEGGMIDCVEVTSMGVVQAAEELGIFGAVDSEVRPPKAGNSFKLDRDMLG